ncbi:MAG: ribonuclease III [Deltaproteobacteria bacterium]|nr:ribonuclease III [Deltaproteobacteria bacterium]
MVSRQEKKLLKEFEKKLGYRFRRRAWLKHALTHKSHANEQRMPAVLHNERLEFLGDAVLELVISDLLMEHYAKSPEGEMSKIRASLVNETTLTQVANSIDLGNYLYLGKGEDMGGGREKSSLLSDAMEAVFGAIYLDRGFKKAYQVIRKFAIELFDQLDNDDFYKDYKTMLQERAQELFRTVPRYKLIRELGPDHDKTFEVSISVKNKVWGQGLGKSKKSAEQNAAKEALENLANYSSHELEEAENSESSSDKEEALKEA